LWRVFDDPDEHFAHTVVDIFGIDELTIEVLYFPAPRLHALFNLLHKRTVNSSPRDDGSEEGAGRAFADAAHEVQARIVAAGIVLPFSRV
jgi:hypothetical protein